MMGINKVILLGNAAKEPTHTQLEDGTTTAKFALATTETFRLKNGESSSRTDWHTIIAWRGLADLAQKYIRKGSLLYVEGKLQHRSFDNKDGQKQYISEIIAERILLLDKKPKTEHEDSAQDLDVTPF